MQFVLICFGRQLIHVINFTDGNKAYLQCGTETPKTINANQHKQQNLTVAVDWPKERRPDSINGHSYEATPGVGGEKICMVTAGDSDIVWMLPYPSNYPYDIWDIAASHAILKAAGGELVDNKTGALIIYPTTNTAAPPCVGGHLDMLRQVGFSVKRPAVGQHHDLSEGP